MIIRNSSDKATLKVVNNHPVHILNSNGSFSPSAFIPFCSFGRNLHLVGTKIDEFDFPICNIFTPKILNNHLCYEADLSELKDSTNLVEQYKMGLVLILDYNEDRQFLMGSEKRKEYTHKNLITIDDEEKLKVYFDTISKRYFTNCHIIFIKSIQNPLY